ncbi:MAG: amidohydrolase family protein, partial [Cyclobacteriaceae bacterium]
FENGYIDTYQQGEEKHQVQCKEVEEFCALKYDIDRWILNGLRNGEVLLLLGTDSGTGGMGIVPGYSIHDELDVLVENGFTPYEALVTGTVNAGIVIENMGGEGNIGTIAVGNQADLILVAGNPLEDVSNLRSPLGVISDGRWYSAEFLSELIQP